MQKLFLSFALSLVCYISLAQQISGVVVGQNNEKLQSANIVLKDSKRFAFSDENGNFSIDIGKLAKGTIQISFIGYKTFEKEFQISNHQNIDLGEVILEEVRFESDEVSIVATRKSNTIGSIPADVSVINNKQMQRIASDKIDQNLKFNSGVYLDRPFGIFGKSVVGIRSIVSNSPGRQLTLIDGIPINKSDGGGTNWNRIIESDFERIEVLKGPGAAIFGNNAMGGIINLVHKKPVHKGVVGEMGLSYSSYNTMQADFNIMQKFKENTNSFYYSIAAKALKSDGYITVPDSIRSETDTSVFLQEYGVNARVGYLFKDYSNIEFEYNYYDENRGQGTRILLEDGAVARYKTDFSNISYSKSYGKLKFNIKLFYQLENYQRDIEKLKKGNYTYIKVNSERKDIGYSAIFHYGIKNHNLSLGTDFKNGSVYGVDEYQTSTDKVINQGKQNVYNFYLVDEWKMTSKFKSVLSLHYALINFYDGEFSLEDYTSETDYMLKDTAPLENKNWGGFSPRLSFQYDFSAKSNLYSIFSYGYRAPNLDDLTRYGFINIGYKNASPNLLPERIRNLEIGYRLQHDKWELNSNVYYSQGYDFMYYVFTGETMFGGRKKVYQKENIDLVQMYGAELSLNYIINRSFSINANYSYNGSDIVHFENNKELEGKKLAYVPGDIANLTIFFKYKNWNSSLNTHYQGLMYLDEQNNFEVNPLFSMDIYVAYKFFKHINTGISIQNIFNEQHMVSSDQISLGTFAKLSLSYQF
jgi:iron complex outermembrane receptor protein